MIIIIINFNVFKCFDYKHFSTLFSTFFIINLFSTVCFPLLAQEHISHFPHSSHLDRFYLFRLSRGLKESFFQLFVRIFEF